ncbi:Glycosyl hydrolase family 20, catalytic domain containing protein [Trichomonas vaginalis G3]|uniref:beta-N-acetylhexosaminidase n=1 Tax=Trichomonas vaginalis (strain ATCC PRA-98 / G3) TaxID=412133 RepID=A2FDA0_TRIV3|nr:glycosyl hydrolase [Trichomonas vaginalis G3]EAX97102.1 Glycosyl hydrolase family 20, catalytic domain containing protein [Trichomonas vaginalis G3]KAI5513222.1 GH20 DspB LnbB-like domain-containing protein [Trichomonas vaginalis G3]|eukprot:XP_001310032.1 glycosyl hydrolase [Trichomonas vaginalis G3]
MSILLESLQLHNAMYNNSFITRNAFMLDVARRKMTKDQILQAINSINITCFRYLMLHLSDDQSYSLGFITDTLKIGKQTIGNGWLTDSDLAEIVSLAKSKSLYLIPDIDAPSHVGSWYKSYQSSGESTDIFSDSNTLDIEKLDSSSGVYEIYKKCMTIFKDVSNYINIGVDEVPGNTYYANQLASHINKINQIAKENNYKTVVWNDALNGKLLQQLDSDITIMYWHDSDVNTFEALLNTKNPIKNAYYDTNYDNVHDLDEPEYQKGKITKFVNNLINNNILCLWGEDSEDITHDQIINFINDVQNEMIKNNKIIPIEKREESKSDDGNGTYNGNKTDGSLITPTISPIPDDSSKKGLTNQEKGMIAGIVIAVVAIAAIVVGIFLFRKKCQQEDSAEEIQNI